MIKIFSLSFLLAVSTVSMAQNRSSVKGKVIDSASLSPLELATIAIVDPNDSSLVSYTVSTKDGTFSLRNLPSSKDLKIVISYVGYENYRKILNLVKEDNRDLGIIKMHVNILGEVVVKAERQAITIRKDTIEFSPEAFKTRPNAVIEDLLQLLPGVQVDYDGTISMNGKKVKKVLVEGREFFGSDLRIATKNLNVDLIDKLQIYDDREDDPDHLIPETQIEKIINLKLKKEIKKSTFGKIYTGGGTNKRREIGGMLNNFRDTLQVSLIAFENNVNRSTFSSGDIANMGGFNRSGNSQDVNFGGRSYGLQTIASAGVNINNDWTKNLKTNLTYFYTNTKNDAENLTNQQRFIPDNTLFSQSSSTREDNSNNHIVSGRMLWGIDSLNNIRFTPKLSFSANNYHTNYASNSSNLTQQLNTGSSSNEQRNNTFSYSHNITYGLKLPKDATFRWINDVSLSPNNTGKTYNLTDNTLFNPTETKFTQDQRISKEDEYRYFHSWLTYRKSFNKKFSGDVSFGSTFSTSNNNTDTYRLNALTGLYDEFITSQSADYIRKSTLLHYNARLRFAPAKGITTEFGITARTADFKNSFGGGFDDLNQHFLFWLPSISFSTPTFSASYGVGVNAPSIFSLSPIVTVNTNNPLYTSSGNPDLKPEKTQDISFTYRLYKPASRSGVSFYLRGNTAENSTTSNIIINPVTGGQSSSPVNIDGNYYLSLGSNFNKQLKKMDDWKISYSTDFGSTLRRYYFYLDQAKGERKNYGINFNHRFSISYKNLLDFGPSFGLNYTFSKSDGIVNTNLNTNSQNISTSAVLHWPKKTIFESTYQYRYNSQVSNSFRKTANLINSSITYQLGKTNPGQLKLSVYDLLNQNTGITSYASENMVTDQTNLVLKQYFMLGYIYNFKSIAKK